MTEHKELRDKQLDNVLEDLVRYIERGESNGRPMHFIGEYKERIAQLIEAELTEARKATGDTSDGYHTFDELYKYRMQYNAALFNEWAERELYDVHLSYRHSDGELCFGKQDYFVVVAELPTGQISNHYKGKYRHLFSRVPERERANIWDGHTPQQALDRLAELNKGKEL